jgi:hypothetical protein
MRAPQQFVAHPPAAPTDQVELGAGADAVDQAERRARPLARRALSTARPARVLMRARNPCFFARRCWLGWNVRFTWRPPGRSGPVPLRGGGDGPCWHDDGDQRHADAEHSRPAKATGDAPDGQHGGFGRRMTDRRFSTVRRCGSVSAPLSPSLTGRVNRTFTSTQGFPQVWTTMWVITSM